MVHIKPLKKGLEAIGHLRALEEIIPSSATDGT